MQPSESQPRLQWAETRSLHHNRTASRSSELLDSLIRDEAIMQEADRLLSARTRDIRLGGAALEAFRRRTSKNSATVIRSWMMWVAVLDVLMLAISALLLPAGTAAALIGPTALMLPFALGAAYALQSSRFCRSMYWSLVAAMSGILLSVCLMGVAAGDLLLERYLNIMLFVATTAIVIFNIPFSQTFAIAAIALAFYLCFQIGFAGSDAGTALSGFIFFASGLGATVVARRTMNILAHKSFLLELRDRKRLAELARTNLRLDRLSKTDGLTGAANRYFLQERSRELWASDSPVAVLMCDIDEFKALNDHLGHVEGDRCLVEVAQIIAECTRPATDCVARYGGEEFLVLMPRANEAEALAVAERIRRAVAVANLPNPRSRVKPTVTVSVGVALRSPEGASISYDEVQKRADTALYAAKRSGRNRVRAWNPALVSSGLSSAA